MKWKNFWGHLCTITKHKWVVFKLSIRAGIPIRGLLHDLSKYSPTEFWEGVKYYNGKRSPIIICKNETGYSKAWLHHKGRNKHHFEYWTDFAAPDKTPVIPYKYTVEMVCDTLAAGLVYLGKDWDPSEPLQYFNRRKDREYLNDKIENVMLEVYRQVEKNGIKKTVTKKNLKKIYNMYV